MYLPIRCPNGPKILVPIKYEIDAGKNAAPCSQFEDFIVSIIHNGNDGSRIAMPKFAKVMAPAAIIIYGSFMRVRRDAPSCSSFSMVGCNTSSCKPILQY